MRSMAAVRRARQKQQKQRLEASTPHKHKQRQKIARDVVVPESIVVSELANRMAERGADVVKVLMGMGVMARINETIDQDTAELVIAEFGHRIKAVRAADVELGLDSAKDDDALMEHRPAVVTVMGHVDHGKTTLLDALRGACVAEHEKGGITQHIGAYQLRHSNGEKITFLDTPGHEAFTKMRARGATATDIVVIVIAADDGVKTQTIEAIRHAQAANVPIIIAVNKIDATGADIDAVYQQLLNHHIVVESLRGDVLSCPISAVKKTNLDQLIETILLQANMMDLKAAVQRPASGVVLEARIERGRGTIVTVLIQRGTLKRGDIFVVGDRWGRVRALLFEGKQVTQAVPSQPVDILGCDGTPNAGDAFVVVESEARARDVSRYRSTIRRQAPALQKSLTLEERMKISSEGDEKKTPISDYYQSRYPWFNRSVKSIPRHVTA